MKHIHLPLSEEVHTALMTEAQRRKQSATALAREAVERLVYEARRQAVEAELEAYIQVEAGGPTTSTRPWRQQAWSIFLRRGELWEAILEPRSGSEQRGVRPVIVVMRETFLSNERWRSITVIPLSSSSGQRGRGPTSVPLEPAHNGLTQPSVALCHQITTLDRGKFRQRLGQLSPDDLTRIEVGMLIGLGMERP